MSHNADVDVLIAHYERRLQRQVRTFTASVAESLDTELEHVGSAKPVVFWRTKEPESLRRKLVAALGDPEAPGYPPVRPATLNEYFPDLGGIRVLVHNRADLITVRRTIDRLPGESSAKLMVWDGDEQSVRELLGADSPGRVQLRRRGEYRGLHCIVQQAKGSQIRCEVQVRTVLEEAVFEATHRLVYRPEQEGCTPSPHAERLLTETTQLLAVVDEMLSDCYGWAMG